MQADLSEQTLRFLQEVALNEQVGISTKDIRICSLDKAGCSDPASTHHTLGRAPYIQYPWPRIGMGMLDAI